MTFGTTRIWVKNSAEIIGLLIAVPAAKISPDHGPWVVDVETDGDGSLGVFILGVSIPP